MEGDELDSVQVTESDLDRMNASLEAKKAFRIGKSTARHAVRNYDSNASTKKRQELVQAKAANLERVIHAEYEAWRLRTLGKSIFEIAATLGVSLPQVSIWLADALAQVRKTTNELVELDKELELSRTEMLLAHYMPLALMDHIMIDRIQRGEPIAVEDFEKPARAALITVELIKLRCKIKGITQTQADQMLVPAIDLIGWLRTQQEFIQRTVEEAPRDVLTLEVDQPIDEQQKNSIEQSPEGIPAAL